MGKSLTFLFFQRKVKSLILGIIRLVGLTFIIRKINMGSVGKETFKFI